MTAIAVKITEKYIEISADTMISMGWWNKVETSWPANIKNFSKLYEINNMVIWFAWPVEDALVISQWMKTNLPKWSTIDYIEQYVLSVYDHLKDRKAWRQADLQIILIFDQKVFVVRNYLIYEVAQYDAIGSWMHYCNTALYLGFDTKKALEVACEFAWWVWWEIKTIKVLKTLEN